MKIEKTSSPRSRTSNGESALVTPPSQARRRANHTVVACQTGAMRPILGVLALGVIVTACTGDRVDSPDLDASGDRPAAPLVSDVDGLDQPMIRTTSGDQTGNRVTFGSGSLVGQPVTIEVRGATWLVGAPGVGDSTWWVVADGSGQVSAFAVSNGMVSDLVPVGSLAAGQPPVVAVADGMIALLTAPGSPLTAPALIDGVTISVATDGSVSLGGEYPTTLDVIALADSRVVVDRLGRAAVLSEPTDAYPHGVVGDEVEARAVTVFDPVSGVILGTAEAPDGTVFEAIAPMWGDVDSDGVDELVVTASDATVGARLIAYEADGSILAASAPVGTGNRWRNLLGVAPTGPNGRIEIIDVQTPHIGGILQWFAVEGSDLILRAAESQFSTHRIGTRNLDQGVVVDVDADGALDVLVPSQRQDRLLAWTRVDGGVEAVLDLELGSTLATNIATAPKSDGSVAVGVGLADGRILMWP